MGSLLQPIAIGRRPSSSSSIASQARRNSRTSSMGSESPPAGYFSTFSIVDTSGSTGSDGGVVASGASRTQRRNRRVFVCLPCHNRKLKCDKNQPCSRCVGYGTADDCVYQTLPPAPSPSSTGAAATSAVRSELSVEPPSSSRTSSRARSRDQARFTYRASDGKCRAEGTSHWTTICREFEEACPYIFGTHPQWEAQQRQLKNLRYLFPSSQWANFPFGSHHDAYPTTRKDMLDALPPRDVVEALVGSYMETCETTHRLLHPPQLQQELAAFWADRENTADVWLAQLYTMLALGCQSAPEGLLVGTGRPAEQWTELLLDGAQASLGRSPYMLAPGLAAVRTLCLMSLCLMTGLRGAGPRQASMLVGIAVQMARSLQLHRPARLFGGMSSFEAEVRRRVWATVQLIDLEVALWAGTVPLVREQDNEPPLCINDSRIYQDLGVSGGGGGGGGGWAVDDSSAAAHEYTDGTFQSKMAEMVPLLAEVAASANSIGGGSGLDHDKAMRLDKHIRLRLKEMESLLSSGRALVGPDRLGVLGGQLQYVRALAHRGLLALHHAFARGGAAGRHQDSLRATLESSLVLLNVQQHLSGSDAPMGALAVATSLLDPSVAAARSHSAASSPGPGGLRGADPSREWVLDLCRDGFSVAACYVALALRRGDYDDCDTGSSTDAAAAALHQAVAAARARACRSLLHLREFTGLSILAGCLGCVRGGGGGGGGRDGLLLAAATQAAQDVEEVVLMGKSAVIWQSAAAGSSTGPGLGLMPTTHTPDVMGGHVQQGLHEPHHHHHHHMDQHNLPHDASSRHDPFNSMMDF